MITMNDAPQDGTAATRWDPDAARGQRGAAVEAVGLVKTYTGRGGTVEAVRGVDLRIEGGEIFGFLGPNGAGKSTTVRMLTTLLTITSGTARVAGVDVARDPDGVRRRMGVALQEAGLDPRQTGRELLVLQGRLFGMAPRDAAARAQELLQLVELEEAADRTVKGYSGGMKRRLDLASALVHEPEVLFLDEPTTGLDPSSRLTVWEEVRRINQRGTTVFLTTQYLEEARPALRPPRDHRRRAHRSRGHAGRAQGRAARAPRAGRPADARRRVPRRDRPHAQPRRRRRAGGVVMTSPCHGLGAGPARAARDLADARGDRPDALHPAVLPRGQRGQAAKIFPTASTGFLEGQSYGAFQVPSSLLLAASFGTAALFLVEDIEGGYFDKLRSAPISRTSLVLGRLIAEGAKGLLIATAILLLCLPFGIEVASGPIGFVLIVVLTALWAVVFAGFMQLIALTTRSAAATNSGGLIFFPLLFLTPNFVPRDLLTRPMEIAATFNPVTYVMESLRSLILEDFAWATILPGFGVVLVLGLLMLALNVRVIRKYD
jgi:ABC-type Na+ transport system ATPase subunit NatA/ABC-type multidrug transport system permease subunit